MKLPFLPYAETSYRPDIQGVRATGAAMIMVYHIWLSKVSGGVDVFFVVSGYFMTGILLRQVATAGRIRPLAFWGKIITRIVPSAYSVLLATLVMAYFFVPVTQWTRLVDEVVASAFHLENIHLMQTSVDYLARKEPPSAVQQFWALSIQMQFYFLLPFAMMVVAGLAAITKRVYPIPLLIGLGIVLAFTYSVYKTYQIPSASYFNPTTRAWEFGVGMLLAALMPYLKLNFLLRSLLATVGLSVLILCGLLVPRSIPYPGYIALLPVTAAACLVISGTGSGTTAVNRWLSHPRLTYLGDHAFCIYLWHWPLLAFYLASTGRQNATLGAGIMIIACAVALAILTRRFIEEPMRRHGAKMKQDVKMACVVAALFFLPAATIASALKLHFDTVVETYEIMDFPPTDFSHIQIQGDATSVPYDEFLTVKSARPASYTEGCHQKTNAPEVIVCAYGDTKARATVALVGGSHAAQWLPALDAIGRSLGLKVLNITKSHCPFGALENSHASCVEWNKRVVAYLVRRQPRLVITNSTRASTESSPEHVPSSYVAQWQALNAHRIPVVGIRDNPVFAFDAAHCVARNRDAPLNCSKPRQQALNDRDPARELRVRMPNLKLVDMTNYLCTEKSCTTVYNDMLMYRDDEHLSVSYVSYLAPELQEKLVAVAPSVFTGATALADAKPQ